MRDLFARDPERRRFSVELDDSCSTTRRTESPRRPCGCCAIWREATGVREAARRDVRRREDQLDRGPGGAPRGPAQPSGHADHGGRRGRDAAGQRRARSDATVFARPFGAASGQGSPASRSPTWSTSGSAAPTSGRRWSARPSALLRRPTVHFVSNVDGTHIVEKTRGSTPPRRCSSSPRRPSPPRRP